MGRYFWVCQRRDGDLHRQTAAADDQRLLEERIGNGIPSSRAVRSIAQQMESIDAHVDRVVAERVEGGFDPVGRAFLVDGDVGNELVHQRTGERSGVQRVTQTVNSCQRRRR